MEKSHRTTESRKLVWWSVALLLLTLCLPVVAQADEAQYIYDELGRLFRVIDGQGNVATYQYDAVGNLLEITRGTTTGLQPTANTMAPDFGRQGTTVDVTITGMNLLGSSLTTDNPGIVVTNTQVTDAAITARFLIAPTALLGAATAQVDNGIGTASLGFTVNPFPPAPVISPPVLAVTPNGGTTTATVSMSSDDGFPTVLTLTIDDPQVATVTPMELLLQAGTSQTVTIIGGVTGGTALRVTSVETTSASIFVEQPFSGEAFNASTEVSVIIDAGPVPPPIETITPVLSPSVSVMIDTTSTPVTETVTPLLAPLISVERP